MTPQFLAFILVFVFGYSAVSCVEADEYSLYYGVHTNHYDSKKEYNEENHVTQYQYKEDGYSYTASTFKNSHYIRSYQVGAGQYWKHERHEFSADLSLVYGYEGFLKTIGLGLILMPGVSYSYSITNSISTKMIVMPSVYNIGFNYTF